jgi:hypothetical protein
MTCQQRWGRALVACAGVAFVALAVAPVEAQIRMGGPAQTAAPGRVEAPIDLTGTWVSVVTEDWIYRMLTPAPGDYMSMPVNDAGAAAADAWDLEADNAAGLQCKAFGAAGLMRTPTRLQITWDDDYTLRIEADNGTQTRLFEFSDQGRRSLMSMMLDGADREPSWQGYSVADWENPLIDRGVMFRLSRQSQAEAPRGGVLKVVTTRMQSGYLRANGVPYSDEAILTEYFNRFTAPMGEEWFVVTSIVDDPTYLNQPYVTTSHFRLETDDSGWNPTPCETWAPPVGAAAPLF